MNGSIYDAIATLEKADPTRTVKLKQQFYSTFGSDIIDDLHQKALMMGLTCTVTLGRGWINKPHLFAVEGRVADVLRWVRVAASTA